MVKHVTNPPDSQKNFLVVDAKTENKDIEEAFERFTVERKDIAILLINQHVRLSSSRDYDMIVAMLCYRNKRRILTLARLLSG
jgi:vacuolar-type H+-ATPase subunit F/Vma7